ncbi:hypothetical protein ICL81_04565 [Leucobacter sp. cx-328]|uniref:hypothetical protein n=1 Tax=unclassified Leucobacter TaxID=2621730 RepID=UPI00165E54A8|nr:hypothetical protein [Leucobacter sp. cx-328]
MSRDFQKPMVQPNHAFNWVIGAEDPSIENQLAHDTSWALLHRVRQTADPVVIARVLEIAAGDGISDLAELWSKQSTHTLAGVLWRLFLLRRVVASNAEMTAELFRRGSARIGTIDTAVAGAMEPVTPETITDLCDTILTGAFVGDLGDALDRAVAYAKIMSMGSADLADSLDTDRPAEASKLTARALRYASIGAELAAGSERWRFGELE